MTNEITQEIRSGTAAIVNEYFEQRDLTLQEFAEQVSERLTESITYETARNWKRGRFEPTAATLVQMAQVYGPADWRGEMAARLLVVPATIAQSDPAKEPPAL